MPLPLPLPLHLERLGKPRRRHRTNARTNATPPGARLAGFLPAGAMLDLTALPPLLVVVAMVWIISLTGPLGVNPILAVPLLPAPAAMDAPPVALVAAITGGWALAGTTSPFTASVLIAALGCVAPREVGIGWNGFYILIMGAILSLWVAPLAMLM